MSRGQGLVARSLTKSFGHVRAVRNVSYRFPPGEVTLISGRNGSGKTTLLRMLAGAIRPDAGDVAVDDSQDAVTAPEFERYCAYVTQQVNVFPNLSVRENIRLLSRRLKQSDVEAQSPVLVSASPDDIVGLLGFADKRLVQIAGLHSAGRPVLLLDEPTAGLGRTQAALVMSVVRQTAKTDGTTVVFTSHSSRDAEFADNVVVMEQGAVVSAGDPENRIEASPRIHKSAIAAPGLDFLNALDAAVNKYLHVGILFDDPHAMVRTAQRVRAAMHRQGKIVAFVPEDRDETGLFYNLTIAQNLALRSPSSSALDDEAALSRFGIVYRSMDQNISELSGGNAQRLMLLRECRPSSDCVLMLEPTRGIDLSSIARIADRVRDLLLTTPLVVFSTSHDVLIAFCASCFASNGATLEAIPVARGEA